MHIYACVHAHLCTHILMHTQMHTNWLEGKDRDRNIDLYFFIWPACNLVWNLSLMNCLATVWREWAQLFHFSKQEMTNMMHHVYTLFQEAPAEQCCLCGRQQDQATPTPPPQSQHGPGMVHQRGTRQRVRHRPRHWQSGTVVSWWASLRLTSFRYGNCPWTGKFPCQWNWLFVVGRKTNPRGKEIGVQNKNKKQQHKKKGTLNTRETIEACLHMASARFSCLIMNTATAVPLKGRH